MKEDILRSWESNWLNSLARSGRHSLRNPDLTRFPRLHTIMCLYIDEEEDVWGLPLITYAPRGMGEGSSLLYISTANYMQKGGT